MEGFIEYSDLMAKFRQSKLYELYPEFVAYLKQKPIPVKSGVLEHRFGISGAEIRGLVQFCRREGLPIASSGKGYKYARSYEEMESTLKHLKERRDSLSFTISKLEMADITGVVPEDDGGVSMGQFMEEINLFEEGE